MKKLLICTLTLLLSAYAHAMSFAEQVKISGFSCNSRGAAIELRSLEADYKLYLAENETGDPKALSMSDAACEGLIKNLGARLTSQVITANFQTEDFDRAEKEYVPPRPCRTKCDEGYYKDVTNHYRRIETTIDGFRFFSERELN